MIERVLAIAGTSKEKGPEWDRLRSRCEADGSVTERMFQRSGLSVYVAGHHPNISVAEDGRHLVVVHGRLLASPPEEGVISAHGGPGSALMGAELLRALWVRHGARAVDFLRGAFAALVYDDATSLLSVFRDHVGQKPLFLSNENEQLILGTEAGHVAKLLHRGRRLDVPVLVGHLLNRPSPHDLGTLFEGVERVVPGQLYEASLAGAGISLRRTTFWAPDRVGEVQLDAEEAAERLIHALGAAVERCCWGSSCAVSMSGGLDSTTLWALAFRAAEQGRLGGGDVACVSLVFPGLQCDESELISQVHSSLGSEPGALRDGSSEGGFADLASELAADLDCPQYLSIRRTSSWSRSHVRRRVSGQRPW